MNGTYIYITYIIYIYIYIYIFIYIIYIYIYIYIDIYIVDALMSLVAPHASGESTLMWLNTGSSRIYVRTKLH